MGARPGGRHCPRARHYAPSRHARSWNLTTSQMLSKKAEFRLRATQRFEEDAHGYHDASHYCPCHSVAWRRWLVRPWTLVLNRTDFKLAVLQRCSILIRASEHAHGFEQIRPQRKQLAVEPASDRAG